MSAESPPGGNLLAWTPRDISTAAVLLVGSGSGVAIWRPGILGPRGSLLFSLIVAAAAVVLATKTERLPRRDVVAGLFLVFIFFVTWYVEWQTYLGPGSDNAEALELGVSQLLTGEDPWGVKTRLGGVPSPMLGGYLLAAPFVLATGSVYTQQVVWMGLLLAALWRWASARTALIVGLLFTASTHTRHWVPNQSDNWIVAVAVLLTAWWGWKAMQGKSAAAWWLTSALFGVALSYRFILWVAVIPLAVFLIREFGWARASRWMGVAGAVTVGLCFGPLLWVPDTYMDGPIAMAGNKAPSTHPLAMWLVAGVTIASLIYASSRVRSWADVWMASAVALAAMVATLVLVKLPAGASSAVASYESVAYNGTFLILGLVSLALKREETRTALKIEHGLQGSADLGQTD